MKKLIQWKLKILAKMILAKYKPEIIGITGSVGKTSAKEAVYAVLKRRFNVRRSEKNYNNEIGVPLTVIGADSPGRNMLGWASVFLRALRLILVKDRNYPAVVVLEMGVDRPGDMKYLKSMVKCRMGIITAIGHSHLEFFASLEEIQKEKAELIDFTDKDAKAVLNCDDERVREIMERSGEKAITYGFDPAADVQARGAVMNFKEEKRGISFELVHGDSSVPVFLTGVLGRSSVYAALAGAAVGILYGMELAEIAAGLRGLKAAPGRMKLIAGIKRTLIIDDTYNSSPQSSIAALETIKELPREPGAKKFAVLGDMFELGKYCREGHREVGAYAAGAEIDVLIAVGERAVDIGQGAKDAGLSEDNIFHFDGAESAGKFVQDRIKENDLVLIKGSQAMRMEKIVREIMAEPMRAEELLVRQGDEWKK